MNAGIPQTFVNVLGYADGGEIGPGPGLQPQGAPPPALGGQPMDYKMMDSMISDSLTRNPEAQAEVQQAVQEALASGELDVQSVNMVIQLAKAAAQNPKLWPQLRSFVIQRGIADEDDIPMEYDQGLVVIILAIAKAAGEQLQSGQQPAGVMPPSGMGAGPQVSGPGLLRGPGTGTSDSIPAQNLANGGQVNVSNGEYVIPADVVQKKGVDFFDGLVRKYHQPAGYKG